MKTLKLMLLTFATLVTVAASAQTVDEIISKHVDAIGGTEAWKKVNSIRREANLNVQGTDVSITITILNGKGMRQDIAVMGMNGYTIVTPTAGWSYLPFQGQTQPEAMAPDDVKSSQESIEPWEVFIDYKARGSSAELQGKETIDGEECYKVKLTRKSGKAETYYISSKTWYVKRSAGSQKVNGQETEITSNYSNYQKLPEGIVLAMTFTRPIGGGDADVTVTKVEVNKPVDESIFKAN